MNFWRRWRTVLLSVNELFLLALVLFLVQPAAFAAVPVIQPLFDQALAASEVGELSAALSLSDQLLELDPEDAAALYNLGNLRASQGDWNAAEALYGRAVKARPDFAMARSRQALAAYQLGDLKTAEVELRQLIRQYPMFADARAALSGLLWQQGSHGEAQSHWAAAAGLDNRYRQLDWLRQIRRWPPKPTADLMAFLAQEDQ
ncbi:MAG: tetratricopeptide repeat protein [Prochlorococcaceae cyanobacterium ETNP14_MAG_4]|nr:tetratricopeptide repeat protein [Prochlorococcaceae cyanobacterium ETNP14_MAG_4]